MQGFQGFQDVINFLKTVSSKILYSLILISDEYNLQFIQIGSKDIMRFFILLTAIFLICLTNVNSLSFAGNPFDESNHIFFKNQNYLSKIKNSKTLTADQKNRLQVSTAFWVDTYNAIEANGDSLKSNLNKANQLAKQKPNSIVTFTYIHYNLPNRDCAATASNGQICCSGNSPNPSNRQCDGSSYNSGNCNGGLNKYYAYVDKVVSVLKGFPNIQIVAIVEPDSLPNLVTNTGNPHCSQATRDGYTKGIAYSLTKLATLPNVAIYLDSAHGGWMGWQDNAQKYVQLVKTIFDGLSSSTKDKIRGFATNIANYQPLGYPDDVDPCGLKSQYSKGHNQLKYIDLVDSILRKNGISKFWITDTARNGNPNVRNSKEACEQWCNIKSKLGFVPTSNVSGAQSKLANAKLDAFIWAKPPGESDGCSPGNGINCQRVDHMCQRDCNKPWQKCPAPQAGVWDDDMIKFFIAGTTGGNTGSNTGGNGAQTQPSYSIVASGPTTLKSFHHNWLVAKSASTVHLQGHQQKWTWQYLGKHNGEDLFSWKSSFGTYLSARDNGSITLMPQRKAWQIWVKIDKGSFHYWKSKQWGNYMSARQDGSVNLQAKPDTWEQWIG